MKATEAHLLETRLRKLHKAAHGTARSDQVVVDRDRNYAGRGTVGSPGLQGAAPIKS